MITTGGTAAGPVDHLHRAIASLGGSFLIDSVAVRPGHPMAMARVADTWLVALPGNPQSAIVALLSLGAPLIDSLLGRSRHAMSSVALTRRHESSGPRAPAGRLTGSMDARATPVHHLGSAMLRGLAGADGFAVLPPGGSSAGDRVDWLPLP